jgi:hypothetical protein
MKRRIDVMAVIVFLIVLAAVLANARGWPVGALRTFGFSSGG